MLGDKGLNVNIHTYALPSPHTHHTLTTYTTHTCTHAHTHAHTHTHTHTHTLHRGRVVHYIAAHIEEISENGADVAHLSALHQPGVTGGGNVNFAETWLSKLLSHKWTATWKSKDESLRYVCALCVCLCVECVNWDSVVCVGRVCVC